MKLSRIAIGGAAGMMGLGLIGVGAHAAFTTTTASSQTITSGKLSVAVSAPTATCTGANQYGACNAIALKNVGPVGSTFDSGPVTVTVTNVGTVKPYEISIGFGNTVGTLPGSSSLASQTWACITSDGYVLRNTKLATLTGYSFPPYALPNAGTTDKYAVEYYAGAAPTLCGGGSTGAAVLTTPAPNPAAGTTGLNNTAQNGTITPTVTLTYQG